MADINLTAEDDIFYEYDYENDLSICYTVRHMHD